MSDNVNHPKHYKNGQYECIDVMRDVFGEEAVDIFCKLNAFKYIWRANNKNGKEDIQKANWYLNEISKENNMPCDNSETFNFILGFEDENGNLKEVPVIRTFTGTFKAEPEKEEEETTLEQDVAKETVEKYKAFKEVGFKDNQAWALTRDWFKIEMEHLYDDAKKN